MKKNTILIVGAIVIMAMGAILLTMPVNQPERSSGKTSPAIVLQPTPAPSLNPVPAHYEASPGASNLAPTLAPEMFTASARRGYEIAREIPETLAQIPCYCHCDKSMGHKSLQSCFTDDHAATCGICLGEALMAYQLQKEQRLTPPQIREKIIAAYSKN